MKPMQSNTLMLALTAFLFMPATVMAVDTDKDEHSGHHSGQEVTASAPDQAVPAFTQDRMQAMRARMMEIRASKEPAKRKQLMEAQMKDMETMMQDGSCPMMAAGKCGKGGMMGGKGSKGGMGMMGGGKGGMDMMGHGGDDMIVRRLELMEKRMDLMQMMMQMRMGQGGMRMPGW